MKPKQLLDEIIGWYGTIAIVTAFALVSFEIIKPTTLFYLLLNITGSIGIIYISFKKKTYQPGVLNIIWAFIAGVAIIRLFI
ncbi:hypothetical protein KKG46_02455 [Patescibacteria group bacterium]|nr:hypothetical protein [Patescibacteria group bacterium]